MYGQYTDQNIVAGSEAVRSLMLCRLLNTAGVLHGHFHFDLQCCSALVSDR